MNEKFFDLVVLGGGTVGLTAVSEALELGCGNIALVEGNEIGGECAHYACVPTKILLTAARDLKTIREHAPQYGIHAESLSFDFAELMQRKQEIIFEGGYDLLEDPRVTLIKAHGRFIDEETLEAGELRIKSNRFIICTGSGPKKPDIPGLKEGLCIDYRQATQLKRIPESIVIIGGGAVGAEFAQAFRTFGSEVTLIETGDRILKNEEPEMSELLCAHFRQEGVKILTHTRVEKVIRPNGHRLVCVQQGSPNNSERFGIEAEVVLCATGTQPNTDGLGLDAAGVTYTGQGITVDKELRTANPRIWAAGDVTGGYKFTHVGDYEAEIAVQNAMLPELQRQPDYHAIAWAIFTEPTIAHVGLTEAEARQQGKNIHILCADISEVSRYRIESAELGFIKLIVDTDDNTLIGGHLVAPEADDIAQTLVVAIQNRLKVEDLVPMLYIYPAKAQLIQKVLEKYPRTLRSPELAGAKC